ncbi:MAG: orotidine-5'-phosphate decarboxylase [Deltaproteobacteria bacterium]|nr:orotidine-5'-phosphate decarboxylase [Deltaproteobacteria bacterium]MBW2537594.1 orotidine-5'-phosphate decarboxylase [Deltaproteobacteria bacterium]
MSASAHSGSDDAAWSHARSRLIFALDYPSLDEARAGAERVRDAVGVVKVGLELFVRGGPEAVGMARAQGLDVFLDLKLHDIPATVDRAVARAADLDVSLLTVHASGGRAMLERAVERAATSPLSIVAVTVLTSLDGADLESLGVPSAPAAQAERLARLAWAAGVRHFVCSPAEAPSLRAALGPQARIITPGIRPSGAAAADQKRIATPASAIAGGADMLVVGRPIRDADDPAAAARGIVDQIAQAHRGRQEA